MKRAGMPKKAFVAPRAAAERRRLVCQLLPGPRRFLGQRRRCGAFGKLLFCFSFFVFFFGFFFVVSLRIRLHLYLSSVSFSSGLFFLAFASSSSFFRRIFVLIVIIYSFFFWTPERFDRSRNSSSSASHAPRRLRTWAMAHT